MITDGNKVDLLVNRMLQQELGNLLYKKQIADKASDTYIKYIKDIQQKLDVTIDKYDNLYFASDNLALNGLIEFTFNKTNKFIPVEKLANMMKKIGFDKKDIHEKYHVLHANPCIDGKADKTVEKTTIHIFYSITVDELNVERKSLFDISKEIVQNLDDYASEYDRYCNGLPTFDNNCVDEMVSIVQSGFINF